MQKTRDYVLLRNSLQQRHLPLAEIIQRATPDIEPVFADLQHMVASDDAWAKSVERPVGLGLAMSRRIAVAHCGHLELADAKHGATFRLTLPL